MFFVSNKLYFRLSYVILCKYFYIFVNPIILRKYKLIRKTILDQITFSKCRSLYSLSLRFLFQSLTSLKLSSQYNLFQFNECLKNKCLIRLFHFYSSDFAKALRLPTVVIRPASLRIYRNSTARYATQ